ncbi:MAG: helix-turn-helix domain-containing protein [archaeon]
MKQELLDYGLTEKEIEVFLACLKVGEATANRISELSSLPRSTTYDTLEKLKQQGLITTHSKEKKINFVASDPRTFITNLQLKKQQIEKILPELNNIQNKVKDKPIAEVFQGQTAILKLLDEIISNSKELKVIGSQENALEKLDYHLEKFRLKRVERKIKIKQILEDSKESRKLQGSKYAEVRFLDMLHNSKEGTFIYEDTVVHILIQHELSAIRIKSKDHALATEIIFDELWEKAKKG